MSYVLPQVQVFQIFSLLPQNVVKNLNAFVFGPHYLLFRYSESAEKELCKLGDTGAYDRDNDSLYDWPSIVQNTIPDLAYAKLYAEDVLAEILALSDAYGANVADDTERNKIRIPTLVLKSGNGSARSEALLRDIRAGDRVRYSYSLYGSTYEGMTKVMSLEADIDPASVEDATAKAANAATQAASVALTAAADNTSKFTLAAGYLDGAAAWAGLLSAGVINDIVVVQITTGGAAGTALASVSYASGVYSRANVPVEALAGKAGQVYIGNNVSIEFTDSGSPVADTFTAGDVFTAVVNAAFTAPDMTTDILSGGDYVGAKKTTYQIQVIRGGLLDRVVTVYPGLTSTDGVVLAVNPGASDAPDWTAWAGGDRDDEYILKCTTSGNLAAARFSLSSGAGDTMSGIAFSAVADVALGSLGLVGAFDTTASFAAGDYWVIRVNASRPKVKITDTAAVDSGSSVVVELDTAIDLGVLGAQITFHDNLNVEGDGTEGGLRTGDVYYVECIPAAASAYRTLVLADDINSNIPEGVAFNMWMYSVQGSIEIPSKRVQAPGTYNWEADVDDGITVYRGMEVQDPTWTDGSADGVWLPVYSAKLYLQYRALRTDYADTIHSISDIADVGTVLGAITPENPLAQGVYNALLNSGNRAVYYMGIRSNDIDGWAAVLDCATLSEDVYAFAPLTQDAAVLTLVRAHINAMSTETEKHWRIAFVSAQMPEARAVYTAASHPLGDNFMAKVMLDSATGANTLLTFCEDDGTPTDKTACMDAVLGLRAGDKIRIKYEPDAWDNPTYSEYEVAAVLSNNKVRLVAGPDTEIDVPSKVEAYHPYTLAELVDAYANISSGFYSHRIYNVFPTRFSNAGVSQSGEFAAAIVAGLVSSVPPQQPVTNIEVVGADDLPAVYQTFNHAQLNKLAEYGTLILMQNAAGSTVYVRHQVSTKARAGNLNTTELSIVKNFDSICYYFAARFAPYIGKYNINPEMVNTIDHILSDGLAYLGSMTAVGILGPQIILTETAVVSVQQHPELKDHIVADVNIGLPKPFNVLQLKLVV